MLVSFFERMRLKAAAVLIGGVPVIANIKLQRVEAATHSGRQVAFLGCTVGRVTECSGVIAIGPYALFEHIGSGPTPGVRMDGIRPDHPDLGWLFHPSSSQ